MSKSKYSSQNRKKRKKEMGDKVRSQLLMLQANFSELDLNWNKSFSIANGGGISGENPILVSLEERRAMLVSQNAEIIKKLLEAE